MPEQRLLAIAASAADVPVGDRVLAGITGWTWAGVQTWPAAQAAAAAAVALFGPADATVLPLIAAIRRTWPAMPLVVFRPGPGGDIEAACLQAGADECVALQAVTPSDIATVLRRAQVRRATIRPPREHLAAAYTSDMISQCRLDGCLLYLSPSIGPLLGLSPETALGQPATVLVHPDDHAVVIDALRRIRRSGMTETFTCRMRRADGRFLRTETTSLRVAVAGDDGDTIISTTRDVTSRHDAEQALRLAQATQAAVMESDVDTLWAVDHDYRLLVCNSRFRMTFARALGHAPRLGESTVAALDDDDARQWRGWFDRALAGEAFSVRYSWTYLGERRHAEVDLRPMVIEGDIIGARCVSRDITDRVEAEEARHDLEQNLQAVIDGTTDAVYAVDRELRLTTFNRTFADGFAELYGRAPRLGENPLHLVGEDLSLPVLAAYDEAFAGHPITLEYPFVVHGQVHIMETTYNPIVTAGGVTGIWCITKDITARKAHEASLRRAKETAEAATQAKGEFLAIMSHEIRTPLHAVLGMTDLLLETGLNADQRDYAESLHQAAGTLATIIDDILDFSKLEAGKLFLHREPLEIDALITEVTEPMAVRAFEKGLDFALYLDPTLPQEVVTDGNRLRQVLLNLLGNALKFTDTGSIGLEVRHGGHPADGRCRLDVAVRDTGIGIPADKQQVLFQRFSQADTSTTRRFGGTGLGLAISQELVQLMGAEIGLESGVGQGSTFRFSLDVPITTSASSVGTGPRGRRILVVVSREWRRAALEAYGRYWGSDMRVVPSAREASVMLAQSDWRPELVLIGWQAHVANAALPAGPAPDSWGVPAVLLLPVRMRRHRTAKLAKGYSDCILDPATPSLMGQRLAAILKAPGHPAELGGMLGPARPDDATVGSVLVVDDNAINLKMASRMLEKLGCQVETALGGSDAVAKVARSRYDLIFMDCQMPETDGYQATRAIRQMPDGRRVPIIAITAYALPGDRERCLQAGMNDYLSKPVRRDSLQTMLERWIVGPGPGPVDALIDHERLRELVDGDAELLAEIVAAYLEEAPQMQRCLQEASRLGDAVALARAAHKLKGALINLAANEPAEMAKAIEMAARQGETGTAADLLPALDGLLGQLPERLQALLSK
jgi:PAS domain S-box-containing protein